MKEFGYVNAKTIDEAVSALSASNSFIFAGGTDVIGWMKDEILPEYPDALVNLKAISPSLDYIKEEAGMLKIGALTRLEDIAVNQTIRSKYAALAEAAQRVASPHIREMGTIGGNICQLNRCWYFRSSNNRFHCTRKGGRKCYAITGDNRYHSIFGGSRGCMAVNPSDTAPALVALDATIITSAGRSIKTGDFWKVKIPKSTVLEDDEIVAEIQVPEPAAGVKSAFVKFALRKSIDFPIVNCAAAIGGGTTRICLNAVFNNPYRAARAEKFISGIAINKANAEAAGDAAVQGSIALSMNEWKIQIARVMVKKAVLACA
jgi:xanthine dehydrogenase YagS FAD-binding subunit